MDCMDGMAQFPDNFFELAVVDPPYGISSVSNEPWAQTKTNPRGRKAKHTFCGAGKLKNRNLNESGKRVEAWDIAPKQGYFDELFRVSRNQIIWGGNYFPLPPTRCLIIWDKQQAFENFSGFELAWTSFDHPAQMYRERVTSSVSAVERVHPTQKSLRLYRWIYNHYAKSGDKILDTHAGSASSLIAAHQMGFEYIGFEIDKDYHRLATERLDKAKQQKPLFTTGIETDSGISNRQSALEEVLP